MKTKTAYLIGTNKNSFRAWEPAKIIGTVICYPEKGGPRACYHISFPDNVEDYVPIHDSDNYKIVGSEELSTEGITGYKGKDLRDMDKNELIQALKDTFSEMEANRKRYREMEQKLIFGKREHKASGHE